ncbi:hypothetical protein PR048_023765 [Dryococelus australis]|uniref:Uncharacterized protein n=1 Tax=Dryococelus australis TaxID=614101 RepID=A0ABQ9GV10_9NEOP|nr:hypothetical protein PR048_023765 [Dryococelus australis]
MAHMHKAISNDDVLNLQESEEIWAALNIEEIPEKSRRSAASSGTILTGENPGVTPPGFEPDNPSYFTLPGSGGSSACRAPLSLLKRRRATPAEMGSSHSSSSSSLLAQAGASCSAPSTPTAAPPPHRRSFRSLLRSVSANNTPHLLVLGEPRPSDVAPGEVLLGRDDARYYNLPAAPRRHSTGTSLGRERRHDAAADLAARMAAATIADDGAPNTASRPAHSRRRCNRCCTSKGAECRAVIPATLPRPSPPPRQTRSPTSPPAAGGMNDSQPVEWAVFAVAIWLKCGNQAKYGGREEGLGKESTMSFVMGPSQHSPGVILENHGEEKSKDGRAENRNRVLPNAIPVSYHCATSLGKVWCSEGHQLCAGRSFQEGLRDSPPGAVQISAQHKGRRRVRTCCTRRSKEGLASEREDGRKPVPRRRRTGEQAVHEHRVTCHPAATGTCSRQEASAHIA